MSGIKFHLLELKNLLIHQKFINCNEVDEI